LFSRPTSFPVVSTKEQSTGWTIIVCKSPSSSDPQNTFLSVSLSPTFGKDFCADLGGQLSDPNPPLATIIPQNLPAPRGSRKQKTIDCIYTFADPVAMTISTHIQINVGNIDFPTIFLIFIKIVDVVVIRSIHQIPCLDCGKSSEIASVIITNPALWAHFANEPGIFYFLENLVLGNEWSQGGGGEDEE
jgi:hypothetical protein